MWSFYIPIILIKGLKNKTNKNKIANTTTIKIIFLFSCFFAVAASILIAYSSNNSADCVVASISISSAVAVPEVLILWAVIVGAFSSSSTLASTPAAKSTSTGTTFSGFTGLGFTFPIAGSATALESTSSFTNLGASGGGATTGSSLFSTWFSKLKS